MDSPAVSYAATAALLPRLLVVSDFDGTLASFSTDAMQVPVNPRAVAALAQLAGLPHTQVAILSGRDLAQLDIVCPLFYPVARIGSHGAEPEGSEPQLNDTQREILERLTNILEELAAEIPGSFVESKPYQRVFHYRQVSDPVLVDQVLASLHQVHPAGARVTFGNKVVEFSVSEHTKGTWLAAEITRQHPDITVFIGDDTTDEDGFQALGPQDLSIKVGPGATAARFRVAGIEEVAEVLAQLAQTRAAHLGIPQETTARFSTLAALMTSVVVQVTDWDAPTPCSGWVAHDIIDHLTGWFHHQDPAPPAATWTRFVQDVDKLLATQTTPEILQEIRDVLCPQLFLHTWNLANSQGLGINLDENYAREMRHTMTAHDTKLHTADPATFGI